MFVSCVAGCPAWSDDPQTLSYVAMHWQHWNGPLVCDASRHLCIASLSLFDITCRTTGIERHLIYSPLAAPRLVTM